MGEPKKVRVFIDGRAVEVPERVSSLEAAKEALGLDDSYVIGLRVQLEPESYALLESEDGEAVSHWDFAEGQLYASWPRDEVDWNSCFSRNAVTEVIVEQELEGPDDDEVEDWGVVPDWK